MALKDAIENMELGVKEAKDQLEQLKAEAIATKKEIDQHTSASAEDLQISQRLNRRMIAIARQTDEWLSIANHRQGVLDGMVETKDRIFAEARARNVAMKAQKTFEATMAALNGSVGGRSIHRIDTVDKARRAKQERDREIRAHMRGLS